MLTQFQQIFEEAQLAFRKAEEALTLAISSGFITQEQLVQYAFIEEINDARWPADLIADQRHMIILYNKLQINKSQLIEKSNEFGLHLQTLLSTGVSLDDLK